MGSRAEGEERWTLKGVAWKTTAALMGGPPLDEGVQIEVVRASYLEEVQAERDQMKAERDEARVHMWSIEDAVIGPYQKDLEERAERAEAERDDLARLLDEAIEREKVSEAVIERVGIERQKASADLERAQELIARLKQQLENIDLVAGYDVDRDSEG